MEEEGDEVEEGHSSTEIGAEGNGGDGNGEAMGEGESEGASKRRRGADDEVHMHGISEASSHPHPQTHLQVEPEPEPGAEATAVGGGVDAERPQGGPTAFRVRNHYRPAYVPPRNMLVARATASMKGHTAFLTFAVSPSAPYTPPAAPAVGDDTSMDTTSNGESRKKQKLGKGKVKSKGQDVQGGAVVAQKLESSVVGEGVPSAIANPLAAVSPLVTSSEHEAASGPSTDSADPSNPSNLPL